MGFTKWVLKHGPGSVGSITKAMANAYIRYKRANPSATENELLRLTFENRMVSNAMLGFTIPDEASISEMLERATCLRDIIIKVIIIENSKGTNFMSRDPNVTMMTYEVIDDVLAQNGLTSH